METQGTVVNPMEDNHPMEELQDLTMIHTKEAISKDMAIMEIKDTGIVNHNTKKEMDVETVVHV